MVESSRVILDRCYPGVSPQLLARVRQNWSALQLDLDAIWRDTILHLPGFTEISPQPQLTDSRPVDLLLLFDQACCWVDNLRIVSAMLLEGGVAGTLAPEQVQGLAAIAARLRDELAAVRMLAVSGLAMPAMQIARAISEDVDLALALLVRRKIARAFVDCASPEDSAEFWRRHVAGGRAFRLVAQALYSFGLNYSEDSDYVRWRKEVLVFLGSAVHTSFVSTPDRRPPGWNGPQDMLNPASQECLYFATIRVQEMCAYSLILGSELRHDLARLPAKEGLAETRLRFARTGGDIIVDQMRWLTGTRDVGPGVPARMN